jgi:hypothetical protein
MPCEPPVTMATFCSFSLICFPSLRQPGTRSGLGDGRVARVSGVVCTFIQGSGGSDFKIAYISAGLVAPP